MIFSNHQSMLDILVGCSCGASTTVAKASISKNPFFGPTLRVTRSVLARRGGATDEISHRIRNKTKFPPFSLFPAGTTSNQRLIPKFRTGTLIADPKVQLMTMQYKGYSKVFYLHETPF